MELPLVKIEKITKNFQSVVANDRVDFVLQNAEIHALVGENGAGKTTLMRILYGLLIPDSGRIYVKGLERDIKRPLDAIHLGIGMVHQHFMLVPSLTIAENVILGIAPRKLGFFTDIKAASHQIQLISDQYKLNIDPNTKIRDLSLGELQRVEILKAIYRRADILILDEPTAVLTPQETEGLFQIMREIVQEGKSIVFITHKLPEVKAVADKVSVMRQGKIVDRADVKDVNEHDICRMMVGREVIFKVNKESAKTGEEVLRLEKIKVRDIKGSSALRGVSLCLRTGEIVGIAGVEGNGQRELAESIAGLLSAYEGRIILGGEDITDASIVRRRNLGLSYIPEDRLKIGLSVSMSVEENLIMGFHRKLQFTWNRLILRWELVQKFAEKLIKSYDIKTPNPTTIAETLSGGNLQKVVLARELSGEPKILIAYQPTRGVDMGSIEFIHKKLIKYRDNGCAVLLISADLQEILNLSDRIIVLYKGQFIGETTTEEADKYQIGKWMMGLKKGVSDEGKDY